MQTFEEQENDQAPNDNNECLVEFTVVLIQEFDSRFSDFEQFHLTFKFLKNSFVFDQENIQNLSNLFNAKKSHLEFDIALIIEKTCLSNEMNSVLWNRLLSDCNFIVLKSIVPKFLCMFGSTRENECGFVEPNLCKRNVKKKILKCET